jgi:tetratricopeptide (TPR) repeat protein
MSESGSDPVAEAQELYKLAKIHRQYNRDAEAIGALTQALDLHPDFQEALEMRGTLYLGESQPEQAFADLARLVQLDPQNAAARALRGMAYRQMGMPDKALADFAEALRIDPDTRVAYVWRALTYRGQGDRKRAIDDFTQALRLGESPYVYNERAACHYRSGNYAQAIADHTSAYNLDPDDEATCNGLAWILATCPTASLRNGKRAVELATKACEKTRYEDSGYVDTLAVAHAEAGNFAEAIRVCQQVISMVKLEERAEYEERLALFKAGKAFQVAGTL